MVTHTISEIKKEDKYWILFILALLFYTSIFVTFRFVLIRYIVLVNIFFIVSYGIISKRNCIGFRECILAATMMIYHYMSGNPIKDVIGISAGIVSMAMAGNIISYYKNNDSRGIRLLIGTVIAGYTIYAVLDTLCLLGQPEYFLYRGWPEWGNGNYWVVTVHVLYFHAIMASIFPLIIFFKRHKLISIIGIISALYLSVVVIRMNTRMSIAILVIIFTINVIVYLLLHRGEKSRQTKHILCGIYALLGLVLFGVILCFFNVFNIKPTAIYQNFISTLTRDGGIFNNIRFQFHRNVLAQMFENPMGGFHADLLGLPHAHNVWMDILNGYGLIPFGLFSVYTIITFVDVIRLVASKDVDEEVKYLILSVYMSFVLFFTIESPVWIMGYYSLLPWTFINGITYGVMRRGKVRI